MDENGEVASSAGDVRSGRKKPSNPVAKLAPDAIKIPAAPPAIMSPIPLITKSLVRPLRWTIATTANPTARKETAVTGLIDGYPGTKERSKATSISTPTRAVTATMIVAKYAALRRKSFSLDT